MEKVIMTGGCGQDNDTVITHADGISLSNCGPQLLLWILLNVAWSRNQQQRDK